jgi:hypothetical protein
MTPRKPAIAPMPWREPYELLMAFAQLQTREEADVMAEMVPKACRNLKRRGYYLKQRSLVGKECQPTLRDQAFSEALRELWNALADNPILPMEARERALDVLSDLMVRESGGHFPRK